MSHTPLGLLGRLPDPMIPSLVKTRFQRYNQLPVEDFTKGGLIHAIP